ncbi:hypothetical protein BSKO_11974 [Bryopsis sp. KO-2023]|nr:hypothetical protein BSKO_11974 [Bryopsis sp. KO-2023]
MERVQGISFGSAMCAKPVGLSRPKQLAYRKTSRKHCSQVFSAAADVESTSAVSEASKEALMLRAIKGESVERPPVWMMRQAGRYMKVYQDLCKKHTTFRERSENVDLSVEITLQPWHAFKPDGVVLFSDILTPLPGMNIPFDIVKGKGPIIDNPIRTMEQVNAMTPLDGEAAVPFVGESLRQVKQAVGNESTVLGFVGAPFTLASYIVEGGSSKNYTHIKKLAYQQPEVLHALLGRLADNIADYCRYQADSGAEVIQIFDSWASHLSPQDFDVFAGPYIKEIIESFRKTHPQVPIILYISGSGGILERMAACNPDVISLDYTVDMLDSLKRLGTGFGIQGNLDPGILFGSKDVIEQRIIELVRQTQSQDVRHVLNLGHGVLVGTPEENVAHYFEVARTVHERL